MAVWLPRTKDAAEVEPLPTIASRSKVSVSFKPDMENAQPKSVQDQRLPKNSGDNSFPHFHWWSHKGSAEWIQYDLAEPAKVSGCQVYWFDDTGVGSCRIPAQWRLLARQGEDWVEVKPRAEEANTAKTLGCAAAEEAARAEPFSLEGGSPLRAEAS